MTDYSKFQMIVDVPATNPGMGFSETAEAISDLIVSSDPQFAVALYGPWGTGKTTLMRAIRDAVDASKVDTISLEFSAWRYEKEENLIVPLLDSLRLALVEYAERREASSVTIGRAARRTATTVSRVVTSLLAGMALKVGLPGAFDITFDANKALTESRKPSSRKQSSAAKFAQRLTSPEFPQSPYHAAFTALAEAFSQFLRSGRRVVIFVDDLDRCLPEGMLQVLESMKLFFDMRGFVFVVGLDRDVVERAIDARYANLSEGMSATPTAIRGADYLKKMFQLPFSLSPVTARQVTELLEGICAQKQPPLHADQITDLMGTVQPHLTQLFGDAPINPREVKRYINSYTVQMKISQRDEAEAPVVLTLNTLAFRPDCEALYLAIATWGSAATAALRAFVDNPDDDAELRACDLRRGDIPPDILGYLAPDGAGAMLLAIDDPTPFIRLGESARTSSELSGIRTDYASLHGLVQAFTLDAGDPQDAVSAFGKLYQQIGDRAQRNPAIRSQLEGAGRALAELRSDMDDATRSAAAESILGALRWVLQELQRMETT